MGSGSWSTTSYARYAASTTTKTTEQIYTKRDLDDYLNPKSIKMRESRDSDAHPESTAIIVAIDVTGSMGMLADTIARQGLGVLFKEILARKPVSDPHLMFMAIGDAEWDQAPLQVSQFEADNVIIDQLQKIWIEHGGGSNNSESYNLPWWFAAMHTSIDCMEKRGKKGYLFTIGDEQFPHPLTAKQIEKFIGDTPEVDPSNQELLDMVGRSYEVFHLMVGEGSYARSMSDAVRRTWTAGIGQRALWLSDHTKLAEVIVSAIEVNEGRDRAAVTSSWSGDTSMVVAEALQPMTGKKSGGDAGIVRF